jgi:glycosyltransferase involved in cell wall biosynthesis
MKNRTIGIIVTYPEKGVKHTNFSGIAGYTKNLLESCDKEFKNKIVIFSDIKNSKNLFIEDNMEINECWTRGNNNFDKQIIEEIKKYPNIKIVHIQHEFNLFGGSRTILKYLTLLKKLKKLGKKVIVTYHGVVAQKIINGNFNKVNQLGLPNFVIKKVFKYVYKKSSKHIDISIVHEEYFKETLIRDYGFKDNQIFVIPHGVESNLKSIPRDKARKELNIPENKKVLLFFGFLAGYKGVDLLVETFNQLDGDYLLILAGGKPKRVEKDKKYNKWYEKFNNSIKDNPNIISTGFVEDDKITAYFSAADVLILPYLYMLSASGPMNFSMAYELPFLASDAFDEVWSRILPEAIFKRDSQSLKNSIIQFFENKNKFQKDITLLKNQRSWKNVANKTQEVWEE